MPKKSRLETIPPSFLEVGMFLRSGTAINPPEMFSRVPTTGPYTSPIKALSTSVDEVQVEVCETCDGGVDDFPPVESMVPSPVSSEKKKKGKKNKKKKKAKKELSKAEQWKTFQAKWEDLRNLHLAAITGAIFGGPSPVSPFKFSLSPLEDPWKDFLDHYKEERKQKFPENPFPDLPEDLSEPVVPDLGNESWDEHESWDAFQDEWKENFTDEFAEEFGTNAIYEILNYENYEVPGMWQGLKRWKTFLWQYHEDKKLFFPDSDSRVPLPFSSSPAPPPTPTVPEPIPPADITPPSPFPSTSTSSLLDVVPLPSSSPTPISNDPITSTFISSLSPYAEVWTPVRPRSRAKARKSRNDGALVSALTSPSHLCSSATPSIPSANCGAAVSTPSARESIEFLTTVRIF